MKNFFLNPFLGPFNPKTSKQHFSQAKPFKSILSAHSIVSSCQKIRETSCINFDETWKASFCLFWPENLRIIFFPKKSCSITFQVRWHRNFMQKDQKISRRNSWEICINRQTNKQRVFHGIFSSWVQKSEKKHSVTSQLDPAWSELLHLTNVCH